MLVGPADIMMEGFVLRSLDVSACGETLGAPNIAKDGYADVLVGW